jgi:hypothetical protein
MELKDVKTLTEHKMWEHGLIQKGWKFEFGRGKFQFGLCSHGKRIIRISRHLSLINDRERVLLTVLHEIAHALVGSGHGHDKVWKAKCIEIGGDGNRCYTKKNTTTFDRVSKKTAVVNGVTLTSGDPIKVDRGTQGGITPATFIEYIPRNHRYPVIVDIYGKRWKYPTCLVIAKKKVENS